jgi:hypothetical protein
MLVIGDAGNMAERIRAGGKPVERVKGLRRLMGAGDRVGDGEGVAA